MANLSSYSLRRDLTDLTTGAGVAGIRVVTPTLAAEVADVRRLLLQVKDNDGVNVASVHNMLVEIRGANAAVPADLTECTVTDGGVGTIVAGGGGGGPHYIIATDATGLSDIDITDVAGASGETVQIIVQPLNFFAAPLMVTCTFD